MDKKDIKTAIKNLDLTSKNLDKKNFKLLFFVADSKGVPVGSLTYTYEFAYTLQEMGYKVQMLYAENEFVGVSSWLGEKYASMTHLNTAKDNVDISPCDFLFIPELFSNVMAKTKNLPCKKIAILENFNYMTELIPYGTSWETFGIKDCITTSESMSKRIKEVFPTINTYIVRPRIDSCFKSNSKDNLIVNIISKDESVINKVVKPFKWKYPLYDFVTFRYLNGRSREELAKYLADGSISIWFDDQTDFGYTALEAMACGNIVIGKIPENEPEWMVDENGELLDNGIWFYKTRDCHNIIANVIQTVLYDKVPEKLTDNVKETLLKYTSDNQKNDIDNTIKTIISSRKNEIEMMTKALNNNIEENNEK